MFTHANMQAAQAALAAYRANPAAPFAECEAHFVETAKGVEVRCLDVASGRKFLLSNRPAPAA